MNLHLGLSIKILALLVGIAPMAFAQEENKPPLVEVQYYQDNLAPYKDRQENSGIFVGVNYEAVALNNYVSTLDGKKYEALFSSDGVPLIHLFVDYKYNTGIGSFAAGLDYGQGELSSSRSGASRTLKLTRYGVGLKFTADMLMDEPYAAPYLGINAWQMGISESSPTDSFSATTKIGYNYSLGVLIQLNFLDRDTATVGTYNWGLENTFLDIYTTKYAKTSAVDDPNTETDFLYGAGIRLEF